MAGEVNIGSHGRVGAGADRPTRKPILIVQGGQWGSEAKGLITHKLTMAKQVSYAVRTGTINAGHTVYHEGTAYAMQQLPVSWVRSGCKLVVGPGAYIHPATLMRELEWIEKATGATFQQVLNRVHIDYRCGVHLDLHMNLAHTANRHHSIGTTGKGCSEAVMDKIRGRDHANLPTFATWLEGKNGFWGKLASRLTDTSRLLNSAYNAGEQVLIEGTQGTLLDIHLGDYPYTTHKQTQAASWMAEAGLSCTLPTDLWLVLRTYPIKVAGNSGPMPGEISWAKLARTINQDGEDRVKEWALKEWEGAMRRVQVDHYPESPSPDPSWWTQSQREQHREAASELHKLAFLSLDERARGELVKLFEFTTVTKKLRRVAEWDWASVEKSLMMNRPHNVALTFLNYRYPALWGAEKFRASAAFSTWYPTVRDLESRMLRIGYGERVGMLSFGPDIRHTHLTEELVGNGDNLA